VPSLETGPDLARATAVGFHTTQWTVILNARDNADTVAQECLAQLCATYWYPLYAFVRRQGFDSHEAEDLIQAFFCQFLERKALTRVTPAAGKFRSFLLVCLKHFLANQRERSRAQRRGGGNALVPLELGDAETRYTLEPVDSQTPELTFERRWAFALIEHTVAELKREYARENKGELFEQLQGFLPGGGESATRTELAVQRGVTVGAIDVAIHRLRQRFGVLLREQVARTVSSETEVEEELRHLISVLGT
jgi:DNA-directed RNA polymerase specialized sigma24 family protein